MRKKPTTKPRGPGRVRARHLRSVLREATNVAGCQRVEVDPATGKISVFIGSKPGESVADNEVEKWLSKQQG